MTTSQLSKAQAIWIRCELIGNYAYAQQHLETCIDWLSCLKHKRMNELVHEADIMSCHRECEYLEEKKEDLQNTIKFWESKGIK